MVENQIPLPSVSLCNGSIFKRKYYLCNLFQQMMANFVAGAAGAEVDVVENKCTDEQSHEKEKGCAHMFLEQMTQPSANCRSVIHFAWKYARMFVHGRYLFYGEANSFPRAKFKENCELRETEHIFKAKWRLLCLSSFKSCSQHAFREYHRIFPGFSWAYSVTWCVLIGLEEFAIK